LNELMNDAKKRRFDVVLVWRFDRFARSTKHLILALEEFKNLGIDFVSYQENIDTSSPLGSAIFTIISAVAQLERDIIAERVKAGLRRAKENGKKLGRPRAEVPKGEIYRLHSHGLSLRQIATQLNISKSTVARCLTQPKSGILPNFPATPKVLSETSSTRTTVAVASNGPPDASTGKWRVTLSETSGRRSTKK